MRVPRQAGPVAGHEIRIRDLRRRFGDPEQRASECSCGWIGAAQSGPNAERLAKREGTEHINHARLGRDRLPPQLTPGRACEAARAQC